MLGFVKRLMKVCLLLLLMRRKIFYSTCLNYEVPTLNSNLKKLDNNFVKKNIISSQARSWANICSVMKGKVDVNVTADVVRLNYYHIIIRQFVFGCYPQLRCTALVWGRNITRCKIRGFCDDVF